ncbi:hypothetical protein CHS0354_039526 [Potamilus streckersoni]|uniref:alpha-L-fucosidase n=1 Tax=Potamilus streckersoni TaxID=2493646 RepID=A0AAE0TKS8_9BIVA|nr:hypothetical protein CHS0354_039526 [Potamilus streckersoni]
MAVVNKAGLLLTLSFCLLLTVSCKRYLPTWDSIDSRPIPDWYDEGKIGIFIHWGVFSVPSFSTEWFWYQWEGRKLQPYIDFMTKNYKPDFTYADFASMFTAEFYDPIQWAQIFKASGAKYIALTTKHHEGFCNWDTKYSFNWNSMDVGPKRDLVGELAGALRLTTDIRFGIYHSLFEWFHPLYLQDASNNYTTQDFVKFKTMPELYELVNKYMPEFIFSDGDWMVDDFYWNATEFIAWLYNDSPVKDTIVVNDRWGQNIRCKHGGVLDCDDRYNPGVLQNRKWENCMTIDRDSWGYRRNAQLDGYITIEEILSTLAETVSCGGNLLINIGPTHDGRILPIFEERLRQMGQWLQVNGEAIYATKPWVYQNDTLTKGVWYTSRNETDTLSVYAIILDWPTGDTLTLGAPVTSLATTVTLLGYPDMFSWEPGSMGGITINIPSIPFNKIPCQWAWVFKFQGLKN